LLEIARRDAFNCCQNLSGIRRTVVTATEENLGFKVHLLVFHEILLSFASAHLIQPF